MKCRPLVNGRVYRVRDKTKAACRQYKNTNRPAQYRVRFLAIVRETCRHIQNPWIIEKSLGEKKITVHESRFSVFRFRCIMNFFVLFPTRKPVCFNSEYQMG